MLTNRRKRLMLLAAYAAHLAMGVMFVVASLESASLVLTPYLLGKIFGVLALSLLPVQLVLTSRFKPLEGGIGLENLVQWHKGNARLMTAFIVLHPILVFWEPLSQGTSLTQIVDSLTFYHWLGVAAFLLILLTIALTVFFKRLRIDYEAWKLIHKVGYIIILLGFLHSFMVGSDFATGKPLYFWWMFLATVTLLTVAYRYIYRSWMLRNAYYEVIRIRKETPNVRSIYLKPTRGQVYSYAPGQFAFVTFKSKALPREEHHFTISSSPTWKVLSLTIKESGDFTSQLGKLKTGDQAKVEGPFGILSNVNSEGPFVFIAGGIGITPIMSMLRYMNDTNQSKRATLIYANKKRDDIVFKSELEKIATAGWLKIVYVLSEEDVAGLYRGYVTKEILQKEVPNLSESEVFLVGPPPMMSSVQKTLLGLNVPKPHIRTEHFTLV